MDIAAALWGGIIGAIAMVVVYLGFLALRLTSLDLLRFEGSMVARERTGMVYVYGGVIQVLLGVGMALAYRIAFEHIESASFVGWGALLGLAQGAVVALLLPLLGLVNQHVRHGDSPKPRFLGFGYGRLTPIALIVSSAVFGLWVGLMLLK